jgi:hypothetical protein
MPFEASCTRHVRMPRPAGGRRPYKLAVLPFCNVASNRANAGYTQHMGTCRLANAPGMAARETPQVALGKQRFILRATAQWKTSLAPHGSGRTCICMVERQMALLSLRGFTGLGSHFREALRIRECLSVTDSSVFTNVNSASQVRQQRTDTGLEQQSGAHHAVSAEMQAVDESLRQRNH